MLSHINLNDLEQCQRLFHGRGHAYAGLNHINVDWLPPVLLITLYQEVEPEWLLQQAKCLRDLIPICSSVQVQYRCRHKAPIALLLGDDVSSTIVHEQQLNYHITLGRSQNTGLFLDMANGRAWVKQHSQGKNVINLFAYTCAFSVAAIAGGAAKVVNIDLSKASLSTGRENHRLNQQDTSKVVFEAVDIFKSYGRIKKHGRYDLMICDPPSFQKGSVDIARDYKKLVQRMPQWMNANADILLCLNSPDLSEQFLLATVAEHCPELIYQHDIAAPAVFKEQHLGKGLKVLLFKYLPS
jgi:23S rRNA (cytosine1962-C5)-methyltransferase